MIFFNHWNGKDGHLGSGFCPAFPVSAFTKNLSASSPGIHNNAKWNSVMVKSVSEWSVASWDYPHVGGGNL